MSQVYGGPEMQAYGQRELDAAARRIRADSQRPNNDPLDVVRGSPAPSNTASSPGEMSRLPLGWIVSATGRNSMPRRSVSSRPEHGKRSGCMLFAGHDGECDFT